MPLARTEHGEKDWSRYALPAIFVLALVVRALTAWPMRDPGYTDAYYYATGARQIYAGQGLSEPFIWNYIDPPATVSHAGYRYWMPLASLVGWVGMAVFGDSLSGMQAPFVLLAALLPVVAYGVAWDVSRQRRHAILAALLAVFPGFYAHVMVVPDNFAPFALSGSACLWAAGRALRDRRAAWLAPAGLCAGLGHLARADGLLLAGVVLVAAAALGVAPGDGGRPRFREPRAALAGVALAMGGYLAVMGPWLARNWIVLGTPLPASGTRTLFLTSYDDLFAYGRPITLHTYLAWGWGAIFKSKADALALNLERFWIENLLIVLPPFSLVGLWQMRRERLLWPFFVYAPALFAAMTLAFTFPGTRGGLFHSGAALLPFLFAAAGPGLEAILRWAARRFRGWHVRRAWTVFAGGLVALAILITMVALLRAGVPTGEWAARGRGYARVGAWLDGEAGTPAGAVVMAGNAPGLAWETGHPAIAIPNEPLDTVVAVADRYGAGYLVLDDARPRTTDALYAGAAAHPRLVLRHKIDTGGQTVQIYEVVTP